MGILSRLGIKNKKEEHYQREYDKEKKDKQDLDVNISDGISIEDKKIIGNKEDYYNELRKKITNNDKNKIIEMARVAKDLNDIFRRLEENSLPLDYLVALDLVEEIDIDSYRNVKFKGLDEKYDVSEPTVDEKIKQDILGYKENVPELKIVQDENDVQINDDSDGSNLDGMEEGEVEVEEEEVKQKEEPDEEGSKELRGLITKLKQEEQEKKDKTVRYQKQRRKIFIIGHSVDDVDLEDYDIEEVTDLGQISSFTSTKKDLLIVTNGIPKEIQKPFLKWFKGLEDADRKYRIVTLEGKELEHFLIEAVVNLTEESLNNYFYKYTDDLYMGEDVESFRDISDFLN